MIFIGFVIIPLLIILGYYFATKENNPKHLAIKLGIALVTAGITTAVCYYSSVTDIEVWNGTVTNKRYERVSCSHDYKCNCRETCTNNSDGTKSCHETCSTCYDHPYDVNWLVFTSNNEQIVIDREDRQGVTQPRRWTNVVIGEPTSVPHSFVNYIKGSPNTLFRKVGQSTFTIPDYPEVYDYYKMNKMIVHNTQITNARVWNEGLAKINAKLGQEKQVNAMVVVTTEPVEFFYSLEAAWLGGKKNDAILVIGVDSELKPIWVETMAWVTDESFKIKLRENVLTLPILEKESVLGVFEKEIRNSYHRKPMKDFEYLKASIIPTTLQWFIGILINVIMTISTLILIKKMYPSSFARRRPYEYM